MIVLAAVLPHPPILLPQIAQGRERHAQATLNAYRLVAQRLRELEVQRLLLISTHGVVTLNRFHILDADLSGDFERFGHMNLAFHHPTDAGLVQTIAAAAESRDLPLTRTAIWEQSDHSAGVPLTLLGDALPAEIAVLSISFRPPADHHRLGRAVGEALSTVPQPTAVIASGDAVHRLNDDSPNGRHPRGQDLQRQYETALTNWDHRSLLEIDETLRREVDESVISPTLILMGALNGRQVNPRILCSEHPWGVGYVTALIETTPIPSPHAQRGEMPEAEGGAAPAAP